MGYLDSLHPVNCEVLSNKFFTPSKNRMSEYFDGDQYMKRLADREKAIPRDSPLLIQPIRPEPPADCSKPSQGSSKTGWTRPSENPEEYQRLKKMYYEHAALPATRLVSSFAEGQVTEVVEGKAWVVPGVLSPEECKTIIAKGEEAGMTYGKGEESARVRTSKRTNDYMAPWMTEMITPRLCEDLLQNRRNCPTNSGIAFDDKLFQVVLGMSDPVLVVALLAVILFGNKASSWPDLVLVELCQRISGF